MTDPHARPRPGRHRLITQPRLPRAHRRRLALVATVVTVMALVPAGLVETRVEPVLGPPSAVAEEIGGAAVATTTPRNALSGLLRPRTAPPTGPSNPPTPPEGSQAATEAPATATTTADTPVSTPVTTAKATPKPGQSRAPWSSNCGGTT